MTYPQTPGAKKRDTSYRSAAAVARNAMTLKDKVKVILLTLMEELTADEIAEILGESVYNIRPRLSELAAENVVEDTKKRRVNKNGKKQIVWKKTTNGGDVKIWFYKRD